MALSPQIWMKNSHSIQYGSHSIRYGISIKQGIWERESAKESQKAICHSIHQSQYQIIAVLDIENIWRKQKHEPDNVKNCGSAVDTVQFYAIFFVFQFSQPEFPCPEQTILKYLMLYIPHDIYVLSFPNGETNGNSIRNEIVNAGMQLT